MQISILSRYFGNTSSDKADTVNIAKFFIILGQLVLLLLAVRQFQIESQAFLTVFLLAIGGFCVHYFLPYRWRIHWFLILSLASLPLVLGWYNALSLIAIGLLLLLICHLPIQFSYRVLLICMAGIGLALARAGEIGGNLNSAIWPVLGSMFMYRLIVYLYDLKHDRVPEGMTHRMAYFFMLPNVCFPLFPVIDSNNFRRLYYSEERHVIYQTGVVWITRGLVHLLLYRYVYYYLTVAPSEVVHAGDLMQFLIANFLLYLRVSGLFHLVIGILHLFGFALPETHKLYYLSSSFTDFWRRINIYWKDFMMKVFYYPIYFKLKRHGEIKAIVVSTLLVFMLTWLLHSYQWYWLRGTFPIEWQDGAFWGILAVLVVINSVWEIRSGRQRTLSKVHWLSRQSLIKSVKIVLVFSAICSLWSLWTCESMEEWLAMWSALGRTPWSISLVAAILTGLAIGVLLISAINTSMTNTRQEQVTGKAGQGPFAAPRLLSNCLLVALLASLGLPQIYTNFDAQTANFMLSLRSEKLSRTDTAKLEKGYYEDLVRVDRFNSQLWEVYAKKPSNWLSVTGSGLKEFTDDFLQHRLRSSSKSITEHGAISTNQWGMRDREYTREHPPGVYRIALLGASSVMGWGVEDSETFDAILENALNEHARREGLPAVEILNFAVAGYYPLQQRMVLENAFAFEPDAIFYIATGREYHRAALYLQEVISKKVDNPYPFLTALANRAGINADMPKTEILQRLQPHKDELLTWLYQEIASRCRERGVQPVWIFLPQVNPGHWVKTVAKTEAEAATAGFDIINLLDVYADYPMSEVQLTEWDFHPNALGHHLVADRIFDTLVKDPSRYLGATLTRAQLE